MAKKSTTHYWCSATTHRCGVRADRIVNRLDSRDQCPDSIEAKLRMIKEAADMPVYAMREDRLKSIL
jgi:hypothetical protein